MEVKEAVTTAKEYLLDLLKEEGVSNLGLEEIEFDEGAGVWNVTLGFSRPWNTTKGALSTITGETATRRAYRILRVDDNDGRVISLKKRDLVE